MAENSKSLLTADKRVIFLRAIARDVVSNADLRDVNFLKKVAEYIKYWKGNPLDDGKLTVVKFFKAKGVTTKVGDNPIEDFAVLKEGTSEWGEIHLQKHCEQIVEFFGLTGAGTDEELALDFIEKTLKNPYRVGIDKRDGSFLVVSKERVRVGDKEKYLVVVINNEGSITTAYPKFWDAIKKEVKRWVYES